MRRCVRDVMLIVLGLTCSGILFSAQFTKQVPTRQGRVLELRKSVDVNQRELQNKDCYCTSQKTGRKHSMCYVDPQNPKSIGQKFDCSNLEHLENLGLVDSTLPVVDLTEATRDEKDFVFVSACSDNHFHEAKISLASLRKFYPQQKFILYSLGLSSSNKDYFKNDENVEVRDFKYSQYPKYVGHWMEYRFKPLIIAEVMLEYSNIWWMDAHIQVKKPNMKTLLLNEVSENWNTENGTLSPILFFIYSSHSNFAVLNRKLLDYFPSNSEELLKSEEKGKQMGANTFYIARTELTIEIFKWWILCALDDKCMNPPGAKVSCSFGKNRLDYFANCFRFDQSVLNLLLLNHYADHHPYFSSIGHIYG